MIGTWTNLAASAEPFIRGGVNASTHSDENGTKYFHFDFTDLNLNFFDRRLRRVGSLANIAP